MNSLSLRKKLLLISLGVATIIVLIVSFSLSLHDISQSTPSEDSKLNPLQKTVPGQTTQSEVERLSGIRDKKEIQNDVVEFTLQSPLQTRPNIITVNQGKVVFERIVIPYDPNADWYRKIDDYVEKYGEPEKVFEGSAYYGPFTSTYVYATKGFTVIASPSTRTVYEVHVFPSMSVDDYIKYFGSDIKTEKPEPEHI